MGKHDHFVIPTLFYRFLRERTVVKKWVTYVYLLLRFQVHIFCAPGNPINIVEHSHKAQEIQQTIIYLLKLVFIIRLEPRLKYGKLLNLNSIKNTAIQIKATEPSHAKCLIDCKNDFHIYFLLSIKIRQNYMTLVWHLHLHSQFSKNLFNTLAL